MHGNLRMVILQVDHLNFRKNPEAIKHVSTLLVIKHIENDCFTPFPVPSLGRRAFMLIEQFAPLVADHAAELVYSVQPDGPCANTLLRELGSPAAIIMAGYLTSDVEKDAPQVFEPAAQWARLRVATRLPKRVQQSEADLEKQRAKEAVLRSKMQQEPVTPDPLGSSPGPNPEEALALGQAADPAKVGDSEKVGGDAAEAREVHEQT